MPSCVSPSSIRSLSLFPTNIQPTVVVSESTSTAEIYGYTILIGFGAGCFIQASFSVAQAKVEPNEVPLTVGFISLAQSFGIVIALAISGSVFLNEAFKGMAEILPGVPRDTVKGAIAGAGSAFFESLDESKRGEVLHAIIDAMGKTYILVIVAGAVVTVGSIFMPVCIISFNLHQVWICANQCVVYRERNCSWRLDMLVKLLSIKLFGGLGNGYRAISYIDVSSSFMFMIIFQTWLDAFSYY